MIEIRPIRQEEADQFLSLLCSVFGLDYQRATRVFFAEPMFDLERKWALFDNGVIGSILTTVPLEFGWGSAIGIAGVATREDRRDEGLATKLLAHVLSAAETRGETGSLLFARETSLYERSGFQVLDEVVKAKIVSAPETETPDVLEFERVEALYSAWAGQDNARLRRDARRWGYWRWNLRVCTAFGDGYLCHEGGAVRECVYTPSSACWALPMNSEWIGLQSMAGILQVPIEEPSHELYLMGRGIPAVPQMFMTDQF